MFGEAGSSSRPQPSRNELPQKKVVRVRSSADPAAKKARVATAVAGSDGPHLVGYEWLPQMREAREMVEQLQADCPDAIQTS